MSLRTRSECQHVVANAATATIALVTGVPGQIVSIYRIVITIGTPAVQVTIDGTVSGDLSQDFNLGVNGSIVLDTPINGDPWWQGAVGEGIQLTQTGTTPIGVDLYFLQTV
jgi:hypothetical protein